MEEALDFSGQRVLVVGGSSGIGRGIAYGFADRGARVGIWGTRASAAEYPDEDGRNLDGLEYRQVDVTRQGDVDAGQDACESLDVLVLSQGTVLYKRGEFDMGGFRSVVELNLNSVMNCCLAFADKLEARGGRIIIVGSVAGFIAAMGNPAYSASKTGLVGLTRSLGEAWASRGIRVNCIAPGLVDTKLTQATMAHESRREGALRGIPMQRFGTPEDMAGVALFLASPLSAYMTGQTLVADGGASLS